MKRSFFLSFLTILALSIKAQDTAIEKLNMSKLVYELRKKTNSLNLEYNGPKTKDFKDELSEKIYRYKSLLDNTYPRFLQLSNTDSAYLHSLAVNYSIINSKKIDLQVAQVLLDDLNAKRSSFDLGLEENDSHNIPVQVITYDSTLKEVSGYYVYWNFWLEKDNIKPFSKFPAFTHPSSTYALTPSVYDIWVQKDGDNKRFPSIKNRTKNIIFQTESSDKIVIKIIVR